MSTYVKDPAATLDYAWNWAGDPSRGVESWLADGESITSQEVTVPADSGLTVGTVSANGGVVTAWLSGGTVATSAYPIVCRIVTNQGRTDERTLPLQVRDR